MFPPLKESKVANARCMLGAITTKYLGPTASKGARVIVRIADGDERLTVPWDHALSAPENHAAAAELFATKHKLLSSDYDLVGGWTSKGYVFLVSVGGCWCRASQ